MISPQWSLLFIIYTILFFVIELLSNKFPHLTKLNWLQRFNKKKGGGGRGEGRTLPEDTNVNSDRKINIFCSSASIPLLSLWYLWYLFLTNTWLFVAKLQLPLFPAYAHIAGKREDAGVASSPLLPLAFYLVLIFNQLLVFL